MQEQDHVGRDVAGHADPRRRGGAVAADTDVAARHVHVRRAALAAEAAARWLRAGCELLRGLVELAEEKRVGRRNRHEAEAGHVEGVSVQEGGVGGGLLARKELGEARRNTTIG